MAQRFPGLRPLQSLFWQLITAPEGVARGAAELHGAGVLSSEDLSFLVRPDARLGPAERFDIYANMYFYRLRDCLKEDFPKLLARIGEASFHNLVTDYLLAHPSTHYSLRELGRALPDFVGAHALHRRFPQLADLARLEWARVEVFDEADAVPLSRQALLEQGGSAPETYEMVLRPSVRLLRVDASVLQLWKQLDDGSEGERSASGRGEDVGVRVWRKGFAVLHRSLPADEERCLHVLAAQGATLARLGELLLEQGIPDDPTARPAQRLAALLELWANDELLTAAQRPAPGGA